MNIVIVGVGKVGHYLTQQLTKEGHHVIAIDYNEKVLEAVITNEAVNGIVGDATDYDTLMNANVGQCDLFIAVTYEDDANIVASIIAKNLGAKYTIARVRKPNYLVQREFMQSNMGIDLLINPEFETSRAVMRTLDYPDALSVEMFFHGRVAMVQVLVPKHSVLDGQSLQALNQSGILQGALITIVERNGELMVPHGGFVIKSGDAIHVVGTKEDLRQFMHQLFGVKHDIQSTLIVGADRISYSLTRMMLKRGMRVKLIEKNYDKARQFLMLNPGTEVVHGDGTAPSILEEEHAEEFDAFIALTNIDEENIVLSLVADKFGIKKRLAKVNRMELVRMTKVLNLDMTMTPKRSVANVILRIVRSMANLREAHASSINHIYRLADNQVEAIDFTVAKHSRLLGQSLSQLALKNGVLIAYILRDDQVRVPHGDDQLQEGDRLIIITAQERMITVDDILEG
ncbi:MAG: Trk system potassium transporter TrkA [Aerococcus sp.]|nr:Trk system potassium transporter TrkA [Aerococcus sp.]